MQGCSEGAWDRVTRLAEPTDLPVWFLPLPSHPPHPLRKFGEALREDLSLRKWSPQAHLSVILQRTQHSTLVGGDPKPCTQKRHWGEGDELWRQPGVPFQACPQEASEEALDSPATGVRPVHQGSSPGVPHPTPWAGLGDTSAQPQPKPSLAEGRQVPLPHLTVQGSPGRPSAWWSPHLPHHPPPCCHTVIASSSAPDCSRKSPWQACTLLWACHSICHKHTGQDGLRSPQHPPAPLPATQRRPAPHPIFLPDWCSSPPGRQAVLPQCPAVRGHRAGATPPHQGHSALRSPSGPPSSGGKGAAG